MEDLKMDAHIFKDQCSWQEVIATGEGMKNELVDKTLAVGYEPEEVTDYLKEADEP